MKPFSLIFPTFRISGEILETINNFLLSAHPDSEVLVIMDGQSDTGMLSSFAFLDERARVIFNESQKGPAFVRNLGAEKAKNEVLIFCDFDVIMPLGSFSKLAMCQKGEALLPAVLPVNSRTKSSRFFSDQVLATKKINNQTLGASACFSVNKSEFNSVNGFDTEYRHAAGEDWDFFRRLQNAGVGVRYDSAITVFHCNPPTILHLLARAFRYGNKGNFSQAKGHREVEMPNNFQYSGPLRKIRILAVGVLAYIFSTISVGDDSFWRIAERFQRAEEKMRGKLRVRQIPSGKNPDILSRLLKTVGALDRKNPWESTLPVDEDSEARYRKYRLIMLFWRVIFVIGVIFAPKDRQVAGSVNEVSEL